MFMYLSLVYEQRETITVNFHRGLLPLLEIVILICIM